MAHYFLFFRYAREANRDVRGFAPEALDLLQRHDWPGNVRELQNCIQAAVYQTAGQTLLPADLPGLTDTNPQARAAPVTDGSGSLDLVGLIEAALRDGENDVHQRVLAIVERELLAASSLRHTHGHQTQASDLLGINRTTLRSVAPASLASHSIKS